MMEINKKELKKISFGFRTIANRLLQAHYTEMNSILKMFLDYINNCDLMMDYINSIKFDAFNIEEDFTSVSQSFGGVTFDTGSTKEEEIVYISALLKYFTDNNIFIGSIGSSYSTSNNYQDMMKGFANRIILPFINHLELYLTNIGIDMGYDEEIKYMITINGGNAQVILANDNATINANFKNGINTQELATIIDNIKTSLDSSISTDIINEIVDNLDFIKQELSKSTSKKSLVKSCLNALATISTNIPEAVSFAANLATLINFTQKLM